MRPLMAPFMPNSRGVSSNAAPYAAINRRRSIDIESGMTRISGYPLTAATSARPIPVFPEVGSMIALPGRSASRRSASSIIESAIRSLMLPPGLAR
jgi:hypothetical protein